jgi:hypothetical protein
LRHSDLSIMVVRHKPEGNQYGPVTVTVTALSGSNTKKGKVHTLPHFCV